MNHQEEIDAAVAAEAPTALARLTELARAARAAQEDWNNFGYMNTSGMKIDEQVAFDLEKDRLYETRDKATFLYRRARAEYAKTGKVTL
jgi:hypothetical protein